MGEPTVQLASIFRRGGHKQELLGNEALPEQQELSQQLQQLAVVWALPKAKRGVGAAVWRPLIGAFEVIKRGSHQFNGHGFRRKGQLYLNIEEAVFLLDQCSLLLLLDHGDGQQQLLSMQEALHMMVHLGVSQDRLQVLSHLCRLGFHVKRHPACWLVPSTHHPATSWQTNPAWQNTDGLPLLLQQTHTAAAAAAATADQAMDIRDRQPLGAASHIPLGAAAMTDSSKWSRKKRRVDADMAAAAAAKLELDSQQQQQQQQQQGVLPGGRWWDAVPCWLKTSQQQQQQQCIHAPPTAGNDQVLHQVTQSGYTPSDFNQQPVLHQKEQHQQQQQQQHDQQQQQQQQCIVPMLLGRQLQQQFPNLRPLQTYQPDCLPQTAQQQQQQQQLYHHQQQQQQQQRPQLSEAAHGKQHAATHQMVYDVLPVDSSFSHYKPPQPQFSIAMPQPECEDVPHLNELLHLAAAAATAGSSRQAAAGGGGVSDLAANNAAVQAGNDRDSTYTGVTSAGVSNRVVSDTCYKGVMFGLPSGGDVNFYELKPIQLMNLLTNEH